MPLHDWTDDRGWDNVHLLWLNQLLDWVQPRLPEGFRAYLGSVPALSIDSKLGRPDLSVRGWAGSHADEGKSKVPFLAKQHTVSSTSIQWVVQDLAGTIPETVPATQRVSWTSLLADLKTVAGVLAEDMAVEAAVKFQGAPGTCGLVARWTGLRYGSCYLGSISAIFDDNAPIKSPIFQASIHRVENGVGTLLGAKNLTVQTDGPLRFEVEGTSLKLYFKGNLEVSVLDSMFRVGSIGTRTSPNVEIDDFGFGMIGKLAAPDIEAVAMFALDPQLALHIDFHGQLIAATELVSPRNKDRPSARDRYLGRYVGYLRQGVHLLLIDVLPRPSGFSFADAIAADLGLEHEPTPTPCAVSYRVGEALPEGTLVATWSRPLQVGHALPAIPLPLHTKQAVTIDLEETYQQAARRAYLT